MFVGEGPGWQEERDGHPFVGKAGGGIILRRAISWLKIEDISYISNIVACRSCEQDTDGTGQPVFQERRGVKIPKWKDVIPPKPSIDACMPRLQEEIYLVDPVLVVALGAPAAKALLGHTVTITIDRGEPQQFSIPGASRIPSLTAKKGVWRTGANGKLLTEPHQVRYLLIPTIHPAYVVRRVMDRGDKSPFQQFMQDLMKARKIYDRYMLEVYGRVPEGGEVDSGNLDRYQEALSEEVGE